MKTLSQYSHPVDSAREIRVFLSSTFSDMSEERTALVHLFTRLRGEALARGVNITLVDLRWGITEEEADSGKVLEICLDEIVRSRPFFIGLVGGRYGWCPSRSDASALLATGRYPELGADLDSGMSITEIEMQYGVLRNPARLNAFFYLKDKAGGTEDPRLERLRQTIAGQERYPARGYSDSAALAMAVEKDFKAMLASLYPELPSDPDYRFETGEQQRRSQLLSHYMADAGLDDKFAVFLASEARSMLVSGPSGSGKSSLLAHWSDTDYAPGTTVLYHTLTSAELTANSARLASALAGKLRTALAAACREADSATVRGDEESAGSADFFQKASGLLGIGASLMPENVMRNYREMQQDRTEVKSLGELSAILGRLEGRLVILIDDIDRLDEGMEEMQAFVNTLPNNVHLMLAAESAEAVSCERSLSLGADEDASVAEFCRSYLARYSKALSPAQLSVIEAWPLAHTPGLLKALLWELVRYGSFEGLDAYLRQYTGTATPKEFYRKVCRRIETELGEDATKALLFLAITDSGLSEDEIRLASGVPQMCWLQLREELGDNLSCDMGLYSIANPDMAAAIFGLGDRTDIDGARYRLMTLFSYNGLTDTELTMGDYNMRMRRFCYRDDYRHVAEAIAQQVMLGEWDLLMRNLCRPAVFEVLYRSRRELLERAWRKLSAERPGIDPTAYTEVSVDEMEFPLQPVVLNDMARFISKNFGLQDAARQIGDRAVALDGIPPIARSVMVMNQGCRLAREDKYEEAIAEFAKALAMQEAMDPLPEREIANTLRNMAFASFYGDHDLDAAAQAMRAYEFYKGCTDSESQSNAADCVQLIAWGYSYGGQKSKALPYFPEAIRGLEHYGGPLKKKTVSSIRMYGDALEAQCRHDEAAAQYAEALRRAHRSDNERELRASIKGLGTTLEELYYSKEYKAVLAAADCLELLPDEYSDAAAAICYYIGVAANRRNNFDIALEAFGREHALRSLSGRTDESSLLAMRNYAVMLSYKQRNAEALELLKLALEGETELNGADSADARKLREFIGIVTRQL